MVHYFLELRSVLNQITTECIICFDQIQAQQPTLGHKIKKASSHVFHASCLEEWFKSSKTCPLCRMSAEVFGCHNSTQPSKTQEKIAALFCCVFAGYGMLLTVKLTEMAVQAFMRAWIS